MSLQHEITSEDFLHHPVALYICFMLVIICLEWEDYLTALLFDNNGFY
jgi:hypothetical protein